MLLDGPRRRKNAHVRAMPRGADAANLPGPLPGRVLTGIWRGRSGSGDEGLPGGPTRGERGGGQRHGYKPP
eukprot:4808347-Pyramimonas_sp.AAC.1